MEINVATAGTSRLVVLRFSQRFHQSMGFSMGFSMIPPKRFFWKIPWTYLVGSFFATQLKNRQFGSIFPWYFMKLKPPFETTTPVWFAGRRPKKSWIQKKKVLWGGSLVVVCCLFWWVRKYLVPTLPQHAVAGWYLNTDHSQVDQQEPSSRHLNNEAWPSGSGSLRITGTSLMKEI